jgi:ATP-dependent RNA circularization protein (DNA/RNA ligase family)
MIGPGIQQNKYALKTHEFRVFNIFNIDEYRYLNHDEMIEYIKLFELQSVPYVYENYVLNNTVDELVTLSIGNSLINKEVKREGLVFRPYIEERDTALGRLSFKVINPEFLLKFDE